MLALVIPIIGIIPRDSFKNFIQSQPFCFIPSIWFFILKFYYFKCIRNLQQHFAFSFYKINNYDKHQHVIKIKEAFNNQKLRKIKVSRHNEAFHHNNLEIIILSRLFVQLFEAF